MNSSSGVCVAEVEAKRKKKEEKKRKREQDKQQEKEERALKKQKHDEDKDKKAKERAHQLLVKAKAKAPHDRKFSAYLAQKGIPPGNSPAYLMQLTAEVSKWDDSKKYSAGVSFDPRLADAAHALLKQRHGFAQAPPPQDTSTTLSSSERIRVLNAMRDEKHDLMVTLRAEIVSIDQQIFDIEQQVRRKQVLKRTGSWSGRVRAPVVL